jgi:hypothetical protein
MVSNNVIKVLCTREQFESIKWKAEHSGKSMSSFLRESGLEQVFDRQQVVNEIIDTILTHLDNKVTQNATPN